MNIIQSLDIILSGILKNHKKVFLGGTCNDSTWRKDLIEKLNIDYFNPVVDNWNEEAQNRELEERKNCDYVLYVITPLMTGVYSIAEVVDDSNKQPSKTILCVLNKDGNENFSQSQLESMDMVKKLIKNNSAHVFNNLDDVANFLNTGV